MWGGSKDVGRNETKQGMNWIRNFVETNKHTNIILMEVPHRYDLIKDSCVNKEVVKCNRIIRKLMKAHENVEVLKVNVDRKSFHKTRSAHEHNRERSDSEENSRIHKAYIRDVQKDTNHHEMEKRHKS
jgi:hypothetical protein